MMRVSQVRRPAFARAFSNYGKKFDSLLKNSKSMTKEEIDARKKEGEEQLRMLREQQEAAKAAQTNKAEKLDELRNSKVEEEMNLKDVFKNLDIKGQASRLKDLGQGITSEAGKKVGSILEMRKQLFKKKVAEETEKEIEKEVKAEQAKAHMNEAEEMKQEAEKQAQEKA